MWIKIQKEQTYTLSANVYKMFGQSADYLRLVGISPGQYEQLVMQYAKKHGKITRGEASKLCGISEDQVTRLLRKLHNSKKLKIKGKGRGAYYVIPEAAKTRACVYLNFYLKRWRRRLLKAGAAAIGLILLTTGTTVGGLIPLWLGGDPLFEAMTFAILFGLIFA